MNQQKTMKTKIGDRIVQEFEDYCLQPPFFRNPAPKEMEKNPTQGAQMEETSKGYVEWKSTVDVGIPLLLPPRTTRIQMRREACGSSTNELKEAVVVDDTALLMPARHKRIQKTEEKKTRAKRPIKAKKSIPDNIDKICEELVARIKEDCQKKVVVGGPALPVPACYKSVQATEEKTRANAKKDNIDKISDELLIARIKEDCQKKSITTLGEYVMLLMEQRSSSTALMTNAAMPLFSSMSSTTVPPPSSSSALITNAAHR